MGLRDRMIKAGPMHRRLVERADTQVRMKMVAGAAAGNVAVAGVAVGDKLIGVLYHQASSALQDLTSEFGLGTAPAKRGNGSVAAVAGYIDNTGGTATSSGTLIVLWEAYDER